MTSEWGLLWPNPQFSSSRWYKK